MTNNQLIDERVTSVIERLEHYACNLKWTNVRGAQDLLTAADGLRELQERRKAAMDSEPVAEITEDLGRLFVKIHSPTILRAGDKLYRHAQPAPELDAIVERLNLSGYEYEGGEVTPQNAAAIVDTLLQQLDDEVQGRNAQPAPVCVPLGNSPYDVPHSMPSNLRELIAEEIGILFSDDDAQSVWDVCRRAAMLQAGNSPVIPDGWKMVPVEPNGDMLAAAQDAFGETDGDIASTLRAAIVAAPQEVK
ncbi:hypothetical protein I4O55_05815 [Klebsiella aerogenes]|uniref:hypothetical protein n=1 Tax=Klebsiella aerogenes TaxID=548 RepID=UPI0018C2C73D|nr:hypothetical protein [Klebsiella aerogenes]MBF9782911.1 hypothetical protein [Klebsiella aerogenes]MBF9797491.1 hypothetical protein [Klebsiella aerogenes]